MVTACAINHKENGKKKGHVGTSLSVCPGRILKFQASFIAQPDDVLFFGMVYSILAEYYASSFIWLVEYQRITEQYGNELPYKGSRACH